MCVGAHAIARSAEGRLPVALATVLSPLLAARRARVVAHAPCDVRGGVFAEVL